MNLQPFRIIFAKALHGIAASGVGRVIVNKILGEKFDVVGGLGQGDPCSALHYTIGFDPSLRALQIVSEAFKIYVQGNPDFEIYQRLFSLS